jgi:hypothetical protein
MVLTQKLELRQGQQLVMTPQLQQAIRLLQLSNLELGVFVENELERNPLLERDEAARLAGEAKGAVQDAKVRPHSEPSSAARGGGSALNGDRPLGDQAGWTSVKLRTHNGDGTEGANLEEFVAATRSLADHLTEQLHLTVTDPAERLAASMTSPCGSARPSISSNACSPSCRVSTRRACSRAISPKAWRCSSRRPTATTRRSPGCSTTSPCSAITT